MAYKIEVLPSAAKQLRKLDGKTYSRIRSAVSALSENPRSKGCAILKVEKRYRIRVGDYRIIYEVHDKTLIVLIVRIGHRSSVYS